MESKEELFNQIFPLACLYMQVDSKKADSEFRESCLNVFSSLLEVENFKAYCQFLSMEELFSLGGEYMQEGEDLSFYLDDCESAVIIAATLGIGIDSEASKLMITDMSKAVVFDALASAFLENQTNEYEESLNLGPHTFRFAPGYGDIPLELNDIFIDSLSLTKRIGIGKSSNHLMLPQKSIIGICGVGKALAPVCGHCPRLNSCSLRKDNLRCYSF